MPDDFLESVMQFGAATVIVVIVLIVIVTVASGSSYGRAMLPDSVINVIQKLFPHGFVVDGTADDYGHFSVQVQGATRLKTVNVKRSGNMMIAWTFDPNQICPHSGKFSFAEYRHNLDAESGSPLSPEKIRSRIEAALNETLGAKHFFPAPTGEADILISAFSAIENEVAVDALRDSFKRDDNEEWKLAIKTAMDYGNVRNAMKLASGSITINIFDASSRQVLWRAAALGEIVVDVSETERVRRITAAVSAMLAQFPPK